MTIIANNIIVTGLVGFGSGGAPTPGPAPSPAPSPAPAPSPSPPPSPPTASGWDSGFASSGISITNGGLTISHGSASTLNSALAGYAVNSGDKVMFSITFTGTYQGSEITMIGFEQYQSFDANSLVFQSQSGIACFDDGSIYSHAGSLGMTGFVITNNSVIDIAFDYSNGGIWWRKDGGDWNGNPSADPATNVGGKWATPPLTGEPFYLAVSLDVDASFTINTSSTYSVPSGFTFIP